MHDNKYEQQVTADELEMLSGYTVTNVKRQDVVKEVVVRGKMRREVMFGRLRDYGIMQIQKSARPENTHFNCGLVSACDQIARGRVCSDNEVVKLMETRGIYTIILDDGRALISSPKFFIDAENYKHGIIGMILYHILDKGVATWAAAANSEISDIIESVAGKVKVTVM